MRTRWILIGCTVAVVGAALPIAHRRSPKAGPPVRPAQLVSSSAHRGDVNSRLTAVASDERPDGDVVPVDGRSRAAALGKTKRTSASPQMRPVSPSNREAAIRSAAVLDRLVTDRLAKLGQSPNPITTDTQFVRRIYLDISGTIPTAEQVVDFLHDDDPQKRRQLIDHLLSSESYVSHSYNYWADILRVQDVVARGLVTREYQDWIKLALAEDRGYDQMVFQLLTAEGHIWDDPATGYMLRDEGMQLDNLDNTVRVFLGTRIGCAQCHDHPFDVWTQKEFYELAAFIYGADTSADRRQVRQAVGRARRQLLQRASGPKPGQLNRLIKINGMAVRDDPRRQLALPDDYQYGDASGGDPVQPQVIFGTQPEWTDAAERREAFATWLTSRDNPRFTLTIANRLWARAMGRGIIEPVDDIQDDTAPSNPPLLDHLVAEMKRVEYRQKEFLRIIYYSDTYQRASTTEDVPPAQPYDFPGPVLRRMTAEQLWDSLLTLTVPAPDRFQRPPIPSLGVLELNVSDRWTADDLVRKLEQIQAATMQFRKALRQSRAATVGRASEQRSPARANHLLRQFGQGDRESISGGNTDGHVPQALAMFNGNEANRVLRRGTTIYQATMRQRSLDDQLDVIFFSILGRPPTADDRIRAATVMEGRKADGMSDVVWALLNTTEFLFIQ